MASHMRTDDTPTTQRVPVASTDEGGRHAANQVIDEGVHIEAEEVRSSRKYFYTPDRDKARRNRSSRRHHHHHSSGRSHTSSRSRGKRRAGCLVFLLSFFLILALVGAAGYRYGKEFYDSARSVKGKATTALEQVNELKGQITSGDYEGAQASAQELSAIAAEMSAETSTPIWNMAAKVPVYGGDVEKVRTLAVVFQDLADNALIPVTEELSGLSFSAIVGTEGKIDVDALVGLTNALSNVSDVINRNAITVENLGEAKLDQVKEPLARVQAQMSELNALAQGALKITPVLSQMLGADGTTRNYLIVAVTPAEMRAGGGFAGSTGMMYVTDGKLEMGEFESFGGLVPGEDYYASVTDEEIRAFGSHMQNRPDNANVTPNFPRAAVLYKEFWEKIKEQRVDGVVSIDPVFLQRVLALTGGVEISNGWTVDGDNAAELLLNKIYLEYTRDTYGTNYGGYTDSLFSEVAKSAFSKFITNIGKVGLANCISLIGQSAQDHRLQVWMANEQEESIIDELGISGAIDTNPTNPVLGVYLNDYTWAKMGWYLDFRTSVDEGTRNADGSTAYHVTTTVHNTMTWADSYTMPEYIAGDNPDARNACDMFTDILLFPPAGGSISDVQVSTGQTPTRANVYGFEIATMAFWTNCEETTTITYTVTTAPEALGELLVRTSPTCRSFE